MKNTGNIFFGTDFWARSEHLVFVSIKVNYLIFDYMHVEKYFCQNVSTKGKQKCGFKFQVDCIIDKLFWKFKHSDNSRLIVSEINYFGYKTFEDNSR